MTTSKPKFPPGTMWVAQVKWRVVGFVFGLASGPHIIFVDQSVLPGLRRGASPDEPFIPNLGEEIEYHLLLDANTLLKDLLTKQEKENERK